MIKNQLFLILFLTFNAHSSKSVLFNTGLFKKIRGPLMTIKLIKTMNLIDKFICLNECQNDIKCSFISFSNQICSLYKGYGQVQNQSNLDIYYSKIHILNFQNCINDSYYWSLNLSKCVLCPTDFKNYHDNPIACYFNSNQNLNFSQARNFCAQKGSSLPTIKTITDINLLLNISGNQTSIIWLNSFITSINEVYKWHDGSLVENFAIDNRQSNSTLKEDALGIYSKKIHDLPSSGSYLVICQKE